MSSGPRLGKRGRSKTKNGHKQSNGRLVKLVQTDELFRIAASTQGKDRLKCQNELVRRRLSHLNPPVSV